MREIRLRLTRPYSAQRQIIREARRFNIIACGRRFGKTVLGNDRLIGPALKGFPVAWFSPTHKMLKEVWIETKRMVAPITTSSNASEHRIELMTGGVIEMWSLENYESIRGRKYSRIVIDEAAMVGALADAWQAVIRPTLTDYSGDAWLLSTPKGVNFFHQAFLRGRDNSEEDWMSWQMPTSTNPFIPAGEIEIAKRELPERIFRQEYLAEFLEDAGGVFRNVSSVVDKGRKENEAPVSGVRYSGGADLARVQDFTVISVVDENGRQVYFERFNQISWERQIEAIRRVSVEYSCPIVLDCTGIGDPIYEQLRRAGVKVLPFQFTNSSKESLIDNLAMRIEQNEARLLDIEVQTGELQAFEYNLTKSRRVQMNAPEGMHDDTVCALALAYWGINKRRVWEFD